MKYLLFVIIFLISATGFAQNGNIRGTVYEEATGETLVGVTILIKGTMNGTMTDLDGKFSLELQPGLYDLQISYISFQTLTIESISVKPGEVILLPDVLLQQSSFELTEVTVTAEAIRRTEAALMTIKRNSAVILDGISSAKMQLIGDATAVEAAKRVTGVSIEDGKYVYIRGLGDRYSKTTLNGVDIPGLDPDRNSIQLDIFPTNLVDNMMVSKNFLPEMAPDFTGGTLNIETKDFPEDKIFNVSFSTSFNPEVNLNPDFITYEGGKSDFLGFDDGTRSLPDGAGKRRIPTPTSGANSQQVNDFVQSFNPTLAATNKTSMLDYSLSFTIGNQINIGKSELNDQNQPKLGYIFALSYKNDYDYANDVRYGEYQRYIDSGVFPMRYATKQEGDIGERNVLIGAIGGLAYKTRFSKLRFTVMHLQNGETRAARFMTDNDGAAVGQSGYISGSHNLEYNQRSLTNVFLGGSRVLGDSGWDFDWRISPTYSSSYDPDIRKTAFTYRPLDTLFLAGAGGNPSRIWRSLGELNATAKLDITKKYQFNNADAKLKFGASHNYKFRDYEILFFDIQFWGSQLWRNPSHATILDPINIFPNSPNGIYYQSGNNNPNPNEYQSNIQNPGIYISNEFNIIKNLKSIVGVRMEYFALRHTGRDIEWANGNSTGKNLENDIVLESIDLFPSVNFIYALTNQQNLRTSYARTIARPSFKEASFAQIIDPITNRIFNGSLFGYPDWNGEISETRIDNFDLRWELFLENGQMFSMSGFYKKFDDPIELVRIPTQQTSTEYQARNVGDGQLLGLEFEFRKDLDFISPSLSRFNINGNLTLVESKIDMTEGEFNSRKEYEKNGETVENTRQMSGQSPYVINGGIIYNNQDVGWEAGVFYNVKGPTLLIVGGGLFPDIYQNPFHSLNFSLNKKFGDNDRYVLDFKVTNILNDQEYNYYSSFMAENEIYERYTKGTSFSIGLKFNL